VKTHFQKQISSDKPL